MNPPRSLIDLPMFFGAPHAELGKTLAASLSGPDADRGLHVASQVIPKLASFGLLPLVVPPDGAKVDVRALSLAREAMAYVSPLADGIFAVQGLSAHPLVLSPSFPRREEILTAMRRGERTGGFALTEPEAGSDVASMRTTARRDAQGWVLDGEKVFISNVGIAHHFVVFANADPAAGKRGISAFFVEATAPGLMLESIATSTDHPLGRLILDGCRVPETSLIGEVGHGLRLALGTLDVFRTSVGGAAVGMAQRALDESIARVTARKQFGQRLADFQLTQAALADMATELDAARLLVYRAAWLKDQPPPQGEAPPTAAPTAVAMAKMFATEAAQRIIDRAVQLHGGLGVASASVVEGLYRDIRPLRIYEGTTEIQKLIIGASLTKERTAS
ncbi:MAG TPA: acyl-CoA dehydrogenase family protein [Polyangiaceae bacterium]|jgi:acyl-CoA dehydrogenase